MTLVDSLCYNVGVLCLVCLLGLLLLYVVPFLGNVICRHIIWKLFLTKSKIIPLSQQSVLITGGCGGVGQCLVHQLFQSGVRNVILWDNNEELLNKTYMSLTQLYPDINVFHSDSSSSISPKHLRQCMLMNVNITDHLQTAQAFIKITEVFNIIVPEVIINNAGIVSGSPLLSCSSSTLQNTLQVNTIAPFAIARQALARAHAGAGFIPSCQLQIITVASAASLSYSVGLGDYCASKAALLALLRTLRQETIRTVFDPTANIRGVSLRGDLNDDNKCHDTKHDEGWCLSTITDPKTMPASSNMHDLSNSCISTLPPSLSLFGTLWQPPVQAGILSQVKWMAILPWHIDTPMFTGIQSHPITKLLFPPLKPQYVANQIVARIQQNASDSVSRGRAICGGEEVIIPGILGFLIPILNLIPTALCDFATGFVGGWNGMDTFKGRNNKQE